VTLAAGSVTVTPHQTASSGPAVYVYNVAGSGLALAIANALLAAVLPTATPPGNWLFAPGSAMMGDPNVDAPIPGGTGMGGGLLATSALIQDLSNGLAVAIVSYLTAHAVVTLPTGSVDGVHPTSPVLQGIT
jgi:hypothetical protein